MKNNNQIPVLIGFLGVLLAVLVFLTVYRPFTEKTELLEMENQSLISALDRYKEIAENQAFYLEAVEAYKEDTKGIIAEYAYGLRREDQIMYMANLQNRFAADFTLDYFNMGNDEEVPYTSVGVEATDVVAIETSSTETPVTSFVEPQVVDNGVHMFMTTIESGYEVSYDGLKEMLDYINEVGVKRNLSNITLSFDSTSGLLAGSMSMNQYYLTGTEGVYQMTTVPTMQTGLENVFGTIDLDLEEEDEASTEE